MKKLMTLAMAGVMTTAMVGTAFAATTTGSLWSNSDTFEDGTFTGGSAWAGAWLQVDLEEGEELASITLTVTTDEVVVAEDEDGEAQEVLRYFTTTDGTEYNIYSNGTDTTYSVTYTADELAELLSTEATATLQANTFDDGSNAGYGFNVQLGQSSGTVTISYTLAGDEEASSDGDAMPVAYLAAAVALAGVALAASKKARA